MSKFETGANNHVTNDFVLTVVNDADAYRIVNQFNGKAVAEYKAAMFQVF